MNVKHSDADFEGQMRKYYAKANNYAITLIWLLFI